MSARYDNRSRSARALGESENADRFWAKVSKTDSCWLWSAAVDKNGYGWCRAFGRSTFAHRVAWRLRHGVWPTTGLRHKCDTPRCVNPAHLEQGTQADNIADMVARGRVARGERRSKLTEKQVREIRARVLSGESGGALAREFGVAASAISKIRNGSRWAHLWGAQ
jgi:hypothetical protein